MNPSSSPPSPSPTLLSVMQEDARRAAAWVERVLNGAVERFFSINQQSASLRSTLLYLALLSFWGWTALRGHPIEWAFRDPRVLALSLVRTFFAPAVLQRMSVVLLAYWLAYRTAAIYLDDIYELEDVSVAARFIRQAAFASHYDKIVIRDGRIDPAYRNSPIYRIGGPGLVQVHLENAALFEKYDGTPHVIGPTNGSVALEGFERLRQVIDLRDQVFTSLEVHGRTKDGIPVIAKDIRLVFSVYRGRRPSSPTQKESTPSHPYPFTPKAIENLVYQQDRRPWTETARTEILAQLRRFIGSHTLSEFLANVSPEELHAFRQESSPSQQETPSDSDLPTGRYLTDEEDTEFVSRSEIAEYFYRFAHGSAAHAEKLGFELQWIGIGTWITPEIIPKKHLQAWEQTIRNRIESSPRSLEKLRQESRLETLTRLIQDVPLNLFVNLLSQRETPQRIMRELILAYREKLRHGFELYRKNGQQPPQELVKSLLHLSRLTDRWIGTT